jgi:hypothetical protein
MGYTALAVSLMRGGGGAGITPALGATPHREHQTSLREREQGATPAPTALVHGRGGRACRHRLRWPSAPFRSLSHRTRGGRRAERGGGRWEVGAHGISRAHAHLGTEESCSLSPVAPWPEERRGKAARVVCGDVLPPPPHIACLEASETRELALWWRLSLSLSLTLSARGKLDCFDYADPWQPGRRERESKRRDAALRALTSQRGGGGAPVEKAWGGGAQYLLCSSSLFCLGAPSFGLLPPVLLPPWLVAGVRTSTTWAEGAFAMRRFPPGQGR